MHTVCNRGGGSKSWGQMCMLSMEGPIGDGSRQKNICVLHTKRGEGVQIACKIAYIINGKPLCQTV